MSGMASDAEKTMKQEKGKKPTQEQIITTFNQLRQDQRLLVQKVTELEMDLNEHCLVAEALKEVDEGRKCFRMIGGILVERTVKEILPAVETNKVQIGKAVESLNQQVINKGKEINEHREKYHIQVRGEYSSSLAQNKTENNESAQPASSSVLVENNKS